jgi:ribosome-associated heat shock protein Hsp15
MMSEIRIDKWLWAVRIFKTRTIAVEACKKNRVTVNDVPAKPARTVKIGDVIAVRKSPITYSFRVLALTGNRIGAKLTPNFFENITPPEQYEILKLQKISGFIDRAKGTGRPTKKERRDLDDFVEPIFIDDEFDFDFDE